MAKPIKLYWHRGRGRHDAAQQNFGDYLSPLLVEAVSGRSVCYSSLKWADMMAIGTILANERKATYFLLKRCIHVWGSGCGQPNERFDSRHYYHAVRGRESAARIDGHKRVQALGDPGILAEMLVAKPPEKRYKIGLVAHYVDRTSREVMAISKMKGVHAINVFDPPCEVLRQIASCEFVISSSLHGLVVADAYGVPNVRARFSCGMIDELKFSDYYSAFGLDDPQVLGFSDIEPLVMRPEPIAEGYFRPGMAELQSSLISSFPSL